MNNLNLSPFATSLFTNIRLVERYGELANQFSDFDNKISKLDKKEISKIIKSCGYSFVYIDRCYYIKETAGDFTFHTRIELSGGVARMVLNAEKNNEWQDFRGGSIGRINKLLLDLETGTLVCFSNYEQLSIILRAYFSIYEDFKIEFLKQVVN